MNHKQGEQSMDTRLNADEEKKTKNLLDEKLFKQRIIMIYGAITQEVARQVTEKLLILSAESKKEIKIYINSQGGHVESGDTIFDMIRFIDAPVKIIGTGWVASAGALIFAAPPVENRLCLPHTRFMIHQPLGGMMGSAVELEIEAKEIIKMKERLNRTLAEQTGQPLEKVAKDTDRNYWMQAEEAREYGLVGKIIEKISDI